MAVASTVNKMSCTLKLNNGTDASGNVQTVSTSLGTMDKAGWDATKVLAITDALEDCLAKSIYGVYQDVQNLIYEE